MGQDMGPGLVAEHEEHEDVEKAQEIDVDGADAVVASAALKDGYGVDGHGCFLRTNFVGGLWLCCFVFAAVGEDVSGLAVEYAA